MVTLVDEWATLDIDHAMALLSGMFSVNDQYTSLRVYQGKMTPEIKEAFLCVRERGLKCLQKEYKVHPKNIEIFIL